jgi:hypothetical protein
MFATYCRGCVGRLLPVCVVEVKKEEKEVEKERGGTVDHPG